MPVLDAGLGWRSWMAALDGTNREIPQFQHATDWCMLLSSDLI
jgi:hypothetical protein